MFVVTNRTASCIVIIMGRADTAAGDEARDATETAPYQIDRDLPSSRPSHVGRYEIRELLGAGAMGVVYRAHDPDLRRAVAIKLVRGNSASSRVRLVREAQAMARVCHPNVVPIFDVGPIGDDVFVAMPLLEGGTLRSWLGRDRSFDDVVDRFVAAGRGLIAAHAAGLVHRDFKPDNVLLGAGGEVQVADFGLARLAGEATLPDPGAGVLMSGELTRTGAVVGTPAYMAPEQLRGRPIDARADQFSFCVALWEALHGTRPFPDTPCRGDDSINASIDARLDAIAAGPPRPPPRRDRPAWIAPLLVRGLAADPAGRWPSLQSLLDAIAARRRRRPWPRWLAAGAAVIGVFAAIVALTRPAPASVSPAYAATPLTPYPHKDLTGAAVSPDGSRVAIISAGSLVIREQKLDRTVIAEGVTGPLSWSPDGTRLLVGLTPRIPGTLETASVDVDTGEQSRLPVLGMAAFLSNTEVAVVTSYRQRSVAIYRLGEYAAAARTCEVPGDYTFLWSFAAMPGGLLVVETGTLAPERHALVTLDRACRAAPLFSAEPFSSFGVTDTGTVVALAAHDGLDEILEIALDGRVVSRRRVSAALEGVLGRRRGIDYVTTLLAMTELVQLHGGAPHPLLSVTGTASFYLAPDGQTLAWVQRDGHVGTPGPLRRSTLRNTKHAEVLLPNALAAAWSPDGRRLAVMVSELPSIEAVAPGAIPQRTIELAVLERDGTLRRVPLRGLDPEAAPLWLDNHRIAARASDRIAYRWVDVDTGRRGELPTDRRLGSTLWPARSPVDGTLAMWRIGAHGSNDGPHGFLWLQRPDGTGERLDVDDTTHFLVPSWSPSGDLLVRALETGRVSRVAPDTRELTPIAELPPVPLRRLFDDQVMTLPGGDLLAVNHTLGATVATVGALVGPTATPAPGDRR
jgi:hypothetical protein